MLDDDDECTSKPCTHTQPHTNKQTTASITTTTTTTTAQVLAAHLQPREMPPPFRPREVEAIKEKAKLIVPKAPKPAKEAPRPYKKVRELNEK